MPSSNTSSQNATLLTLVLLTAFVSTSTALILPRSSIHSPHLHTTPRAPSSSTSSSSSPSLLQKLRLRLGHGKHLREAVVHKYFHGVDTKNIPQIVECFHPDGAIIRDVSSLANKDVSYEEVGKVVSAEFLGERCREFLEAHPDAKVMFHYR
jgi:hypothetical protein